jgi:hypothetical protein
LHSPSVSSPSATALPYYGAKSTHCQQRSQPAPPPPDQRPGRRQVRRQDEGLHRCLAGAGRGRAQDGQRSAGDKGRGGQGEGDSYPTGWQYLATVRS